MSLPKSVYKRLPKRMPHSLGFSRYALDFDGVDDDITVPHDASLMPDQMSMMIAYQSSDDGWAVLYDKGTGYKVQFPYAGAPNANLEFRIWIGGTRYDCVMIDGHGNDGEVHIATGTYDGETMRGYEGMEETDVNTSPSGAVDSDTSDATMMQNAASGQVSGKLYFVLLYNRGLSPEEVRYNVLNFHDPIRDGLVAWWGLEEGTGDTAYDLSDAGNDGTIGGGPPWKDTKMWELRAEAGFK